MTTARDNNPVRLRREAKGLLLIELAEKIGKSASTVSFIEGGLVPKQATQVAIADALDCSPIDLWPGEWERTG